MPKMFSANPRVSRTDNSKISSSSNNKMITKSTRLSQLSRSSKLSVNRTLASVFGPTDIFLSSYTLLVNLPIGTEVARISSKDVNSFSFVYTVNDNSLFYTDGDKLKTNTVFTDRTNFDGHSVRITTDDGLYKFSKTFFIPFQQPPVVSNIVNPLIINFGTNQSTINLSNTFFDVNGDPLTITAISDNPELLSTNINGFMLTTTYSNNSGSSVITLKAYDNYNEFAVTTFSILILPNNVDYNITINKLPSSLPEPVDIIIDGVPTLITQLDNTHINILIDEPAKATDEEKRDNVKSNISSIVNKYITTSQDDTVVDLYIPIDALPFPQLASNIDKVRIVDGSTSTTDNPLSVNLTDNIENSAMYVNTTPGNKVIVNLSSDTLTIEQVTKDTFNVSINGGAVETKNAGDFVTMPTSETVITLSSIIIAENHAPIAYDINYTFSEDSIQNIIELNGYDVDINETSKNYIQYVIETAPQYGVLDVLTNTDLMNKQIKYTPSENYFGSDSFSYYVKDNYGVVSNTANASITVTNVDDLATGTLTITGTIEEG
ncbi:Ig-like domain-containing protein, partial [Pelagibacteraceae bacterium]|nr:Ig-like domain-containing protein [Pelagibacteraceae bacterium]